MASFGSRLDWWTCDTFTRRMEDGGASMNEVPFNRNEGLWLEIDRLSNVFATCNIIWDPLRVDVAMIAWSGSGFRSESIEWRNHADRIIELIDEAHVSSQADRNDYQIIFQLHWHTWHVRQACIPWCWCVADISWHMASQVCPDRESNLHTLIASWDWSCCGAGANAGASASLMQPS